MDFFKRLYRGVSRRLKGVSAEESNHQWLLAHGLREGEQVDCFSWNGVDAQYPGLITIGNYVTIASGVKLLAHDSSVGYLTKSTRIGVIEVGSHVFIGANSIIMPNVRIGDWSVIGAGSVVTKDVPPRCVYAGNPAEYMCTIDKFHEKHEVGLKTHYVSHKAWREWADATPEEWQELRNALKGNCGYVTARKDV